MENDPYSTKELNETFYKYRMYLPYLHEEVNEGRWEGLEPKNIEIGRFGPIAILCLTIEKDLLSFDFMVRTYEEYADNDIIIEHDIYIEYRGCEKYHKCIAVKFLKAVEESLHDHFKVPVINNESYICLRIDKERQLESFLEMADIVVPLFNNTPTWIAEESP